LRDNELDVRAATLTSLALITPNISVDKIQSHIYPALQSLVSDTASNMSIRRNAADAISVIGKTMGNEFTLNNLVPLVMNLLNDDNPEVKLHVLGSIGKISD